MNNENVSLDDFIEYLEQETLKAKYHMQNDLWLQLNYCLQLAMDFRTVCNEPTKHLRDDR